MAADTGTSSPQMISIPRPPTKKWVTFDDLMDDAMESGKLCQNNNNNFSHNNNNKTPITYAPLSVNHLRRGSVGGQQVGSYSSGSGSVMLSSSVSSSGSFDSVEAVTESMRKTSLDFTQSLDQSSLASNVIRCMRRPARTSLALSSDDDEGEQQQQQQQQQQDDKYASAFADLRKKPAHKSTGWSTKIIHGEHELGWSKQVLGCDDDDDEQGDDQGEQSDHVFTSEATINATTTGLGGFRNQSWDKSPRRTFVRNFP